jgi:GH25 family lysozyme M1 (1,4-beta-N-acetylmuramidase)
MPFFRSRVRRCFALLAAAAIVLLNVSSATASTAVQGTRFPHRVSAGFTPTVPSTDVRGIDLPSSAHGIDWTKVAQAGYGFTQMKSTEGTYYTSPYFGADLKGAKAAGLDGGGYHFAVPSGSSGRAQADYAVAHAHYAADGHTLPITLDIEDNPYGSECYGLSGPAMVAWIKAFSAGVDAKTGRLPIIFTTPAWWAACTGNSRAFSANPLAVSSYGTSAPALPSGWTTWTFWEFASSTTVPGVRGSVGLSYFNGDAAQLAKFAAG